MPRGLREQLIGAWELVSYTFTREDGSVKHPLGEEVRGLILYTPDGYMSAQIMRPGRRPYASGDMHQGTVEERSEAANGYIAYSGPFYVDEETRELKHHMAVSLFPNWLGNTQVRIARLEGDTLTLAPEKPLPYEGVPQTPRLVWKRAKPTWTQGPSAS